MTITATRKTYVLFETTDRSAPPGGISVVATIPSTWTELGVDAVGSPSFLGPRMSRAARDVVTIATFHCPANEPDDRCLDAVAEVQPGHGREGFVEQPLQDGRRWVVYDSTDDAGGRVIQARLLAHHARTRFIVSCALVLHGDAIMSLAEAMAFCETAAVTDASAPAT
jgi:hypothetical protein